MACERVVVAHHAADLNPAARDAGGIAGVYLCRADDEGSRIETAEKKARAQDTVA